MSEEEAGSVEEALAAPVTTPLSDPPPVAADPAPEEGDWWSNPETAKSMVKDLREEAAGHRVKNKPYTESFSGYSAQEQEYLLGVVRMASSSDDATRAKAAEEFAFLAKQLGGEEAAIEAIAEVAPDALPAIEEAPATFSAEDAQELINKSQAEAEHKVAVATRVAEIKTQMVESGFKEDTIEWESVMVVARRNGFNMDAAIKKYQESQQAHIDAFVEGQRGKGASFPTHNRNAGTPPPAGEKEEWVGDSQKTSDAVKQWLRGRPGAVG